MKITSKEIEALSQLEAFKRYGYFIKRVADSEKMYTLIDVNGDFPGCRTIVSCGSIVNQKNVHKPTRYNRAVAGL